MDWITGGIGSLLGGVVSGISSIFGGSNTNKANQAMVAQQEQFQQAQTLQQQQFQERMSSTAYQRASTDMQAAGLNPMMMFGSGSAASQPSGSAMSGASMPQTSGLSGAGQALSAGINSAVNAEVQKKTIDKMTDEIANLKSTNEKIQAERLESIARTGTQQTMQENITAETKQRGAALHNAVNEALKADNEAEFRRTAAGKLLDQAGMGGAQLSRAISPVSDIVSSALGARNSYWRGTLDRDKYYFGP